MSSIHAADTLRRRERPTTVRWVSHGAGRVTDSRAGYPQTAHQALRTTLAALMLGSGVASASIAGASAATTSPPPAPQPSAIGNESASWIAVAPNYQRTGLVVAVASPKSGCQTNCAHLWVSRDGGAGWQRAKASGWDGGRPVIAVDSRGHDVLYSGSTAGVVRSDDAGNTWVVVGPSGTPSVSSTYASDDATVAVAVPQGGDYLLNTSGKGTAPGSGGSLTDMSFAYAPSFPSGGKYAPVLLTAEDKGQRLPVIQQCTASYVCSGSTTLPGAVYFSSPVTLLPSTGYANDGSVFAQSGRGIYKSTNGGVSFTPISLGDPSATATATPMLALAPGYKEQSSTKTAWAAVFQVFQDKTDPKKSHAGGGLYRTDDGGATWRAVASPGPFDGGAVSVAVSLDGRLFAGYVGGTTGNAGLMCSGDGGTTWQATCSPVGSAANDPGAVGGSVHPCTTCVPKTGSTASAAPGGQAGGDSQGGAGSGGASGSTGTKTPSEQQLSPAAAQPKTGARWPLVLAGGLALLVAVLVVAQLIRNRRRQGGAPTPNTE